MYIQTLLEHQFEIYFKMKVLVVTSVALAIFAFGKPVGARQLINENGESVTEDGNQIHAVTYAVDPNQLTYWLYTPSNKDTAYQLKLGDTTGLKNSPIDKSRKTIAIIHGWQGSYANQYPQMMKNCILDKLIANVVMLDWKPYASNYDTAVSSVKAIGQNANTFFSWLVSNTGIKIEDIHLVGHSLGAHISGHCGKAANGSYGRITGLDPAAPSFTNVASSGRLCSTDALFVDTMHTSTMGISSAIGHADFYPHGGSDQPACRTSLISVGCDHTMSCKYFCDSIAERTKYPARKCPTEAEAKSSGSNCVASKAFMGYDAFESGALGSYNVALT